MVKFLLVLFLSCSFAPQVWASEGSEALNDLKEFGIQSKVLSSLDLKFFKKNNAQPFPNRYVFSNESTWLEVTVSERFEKKPAHFLIKNQMNAVFNLYGQSPTPYPGQITKLQSCEKKFMPQKFEKSSEDDGFHILVGGATDRKVFGVCTAELVKKAGFVLFKYSENRKILIKIKGAKSLTPGLQWSQQVSEVRKWLESLFL